MRLHGALVLDTRISIIVWIYPPNPVQLQMKVYSLVRDSLLKMVGDNRNRHPWGLFFGGVDRQKIIGPKFPPSPKHWRGTWRLFSASVFPSKSGTSEMITSPTFNASFATKKRPSKDKRRVLSWSGEKRLFQQMWATCRLKTWVPCWEWLVEYNWVSYVKYVQQDRNITSGLCCHHGQHPFAISTWKTLFQPRWWANLLTQSIYRFAWLEKLLKGKNQKKHKSRRNQKKWSSAPEGQVLWQIQKYQCFFKRSI